MTTRLSNDICGALKSFGLLPGAMRDLPFDRRVEALLEGRPDVPPAVQPMLGAWRQLRVQITASDKAVRDVVKMSPTCKLLMTVPGIGALTGLAHVNTVEDPDRSDSREPLVHIVVWRRDSISPARSIAAAAYRGVVTP